MDIRIAKHAGFCVGVKKAVEKAFSSATDPSTKHPIYSLGHLVHNSLVVSQLADKGVTLINDVKEIHTPGTLIISAHGVSPQILTHAKEKKLEVINTTCIQVKKVQELAVKLRADGYHVIIIGDKDHPEVLGVKEWAGDDVTIISTETEAQLFKTPKKAGIVSQTTVSLGLFDSISKIIKNNSTHEVVINKTICSATSMRQKAAISLAREVEVMLVIGDTRSANTKRLLELSREVLPDSYLVSVTDDIKKEWFIDKKIVGITAGASTPQHIISAVVETIKNL